MVAIISKQSDLNFMPGSQYLYSNTNYILLALIIEKASGESFVNYTNKMFKLLGMNATSFEDESKKIAGPIARAYFNFNTWTTFKWIWNVCGDGNLFSTLNDQIRWESIVQGKIQSSISPAIIRKSQQPVEGILMSGYGYGLEKANYRGLSYQFHEGATGAWKATVLRFPSKAISIICFTNSGKTIPSMQSRQMAD
ncbi:MAG: class A beta-lactamase-related serine hydrolase, partial [Chitinophagaceae bacterium]